MPLTIDNSPELLSGDTGMATQRNQRVRVLRAFYHQNKIVGVDSVIDLPANIAAELRHARKVDFVQSDTKVKETSEIAPPPDASLDEKKAAGKQASA